MPTDLIPAYQAALLLACSTRTLRRRAERGRLVRYRHPELTGDFYSRAECDAYRAQFRRAE